MERKYFWALAVADGDGKIIIPETTGVSVASLSRYSAFEGLKIKICCGKSDASRWFKEVGKADQLFVKRLDACGNPAESWQITSATISDVVWEEKISKEMDADPSCPFGDNLHFIVRGHFRKLAA